MLPIRPLLYSDSSLETGSCVGPRYTRNAPSRETPGTLLNEVTDKYVTEFNLPFENIARYVSEMELNWSKLSQDQKNILLKSVAKFQEDKINKETDSFANDNETIDDNTSYFNYLQANPNALGPFLNNIRQNGSPLLKRELNTYISKDSWSISSIVIVSLLVLCLIAIIYVKMS